MTELLTVVSTTANLPIERDEIRDQLRILEDCDTALLEALLRAACEYVENASGYAVFSRSWKYSIDCPPFERLFLPKYPVTSIVSIEYFDTDNTAQALDVMDFTLFDDGTEQWLEPNPGVVWPTTAARPDALSVTFDVGGALDRYNVLRQAILMIASDWYEYPTASSEDQKREVPFGASVLINQVRREWINTRRWAGHAFT